MHWLPGLRKLRIRRLRRKLQRLQWQLRPQTLIVPNSPICCKDGDTQPGSPSLHILKNVGALLRTHIHRF